MKRRALLKTICTVSAVGLLALPFAPAQAAEAEPAVASSAWYWETQRSQPIVNPVDGSTVAVIEQPNPFCPGAASAGTRDEVCRAGRLPIEVQGGDYEAPDKVSAVGFDLTLVPLGSTVSRFTVEFLEANDPQSEPFNAEGHGLQACMISQFFGDGDAREYKERPKFECLESDPVAERKEFEFKGAEGNEERFHYVFNLTNFAKTWIEEGSAVTAVMLYPVPVDPKGPRDRAKDDAWRTVLTGALEPDGVKTSIVYKAPPIPVPTPLPPTDPIDSSGGLGSGSTGDFSTGSTTTTGDAGTFGTGTTDAPAGGETEVTGEEAPVDVPLGDPALAGSELPTTPAIPGYVWLAILAGLMGFSLVRQVVLENTKGIRPDGVLSQIRKINTERRGVALDAMAGPSGAGRFAPLIAGFKDLGQGLKRAGAGFGSMSSKLPFKRKG